MAKEDLLPYAATERQKQAVLFLRKHGSYKKAARAMEICQSSFSNLIGRVLRARRKAELDGKAGPLDESRFEEADDLKIDLSGDDGSVVYIGPRFKSADDLLEHVDIDRTCWDIISVQVNSWEVTGKRKTGESTDGSRSPDQVWKTNNLQIKVKLRRKAPKHVQDAIKGLLEKMPAWRGKLPKPASHAVGGNHLVELSLYDSHFGKLCWGAETGTPYDLSIAYDDYVHAARDMLGKLGTRKIEKIILPVGHDFFNVNNWQGTTERGTPVESTDDRFQKVFTVGCDAVECVIAMCRDVAPVEVLWVPGNHDPATSWYMCETLRRIFRDDKHTTVENTVANGIRKRKYRLYGVSLIGYDHGETVAQTELPLLMAKEVQHLWAQSRYQSWRIGHWHKKKRTRWIDIDTYKGVEVNVIPSLSGTDKWHFENGFVGNVRAAEVAIWNRETGPDGAFPVEARSATKLRKAV